MSEINYVESRILELLMSKHETMTMYEISKKTCISWSTVKIHLYILKADNKVAFRTIDGFGLSKIVWWAL